MPPDRVLCVRYCGDIAGNIVLQPDVPLKALMNSFKHGWTFDTVNRVCPGASHWLSPALKRQVILARNKCEDILEKLPVGRDKYFQFSLAKLGKRDNSRPTDPPDLVLPTTPSPPSSPRAPSPFSAPGSSPPAAPGSPLPAAPGSPPPATPPQANPASAPPPRQKYYPYDQRYWAARWYEGYKNVRHWYARFKVEFVAKFPNALKIPYMRTVPRFTSKLAKYYKVQNLWQKGKGGRPREKTNVEMERKVLDDVAINSR